MFEKGNNDIKYFNLNYFCLPFALHNKFSYLSLFIWFNYYIWIDLIFLNKFNMDI